MKKLVMKKSTVKKAAVKNVKLAVVTHAVKKSSANKPKAVKKKAVKAKAINPKVIKTKAVKASLKTPVKALKTSKAPAKKTKVKKLALTKTVSIKKIMQATPLPKKMKKYKPNSKIKYNAKELMHFKNVIINEKRKIYESAKANMRSLVDSDTGDYVGDDLSYATHMAEQGTDEMEREKNYMFVQRDEKYLGYLEDALTRIDQATYGICLECQEVPKNFCPTCPLIPKERLELVPITQHCIECKNLRG